MGPLMIINLGLMLLFAIPYITSRFAKRMGRNPKIWFLIGILLPVISTFIILFLPDLSEKK
jgi:MFS family permease